ncbi:chemotaxis protein CheY [Candidatus Magnetomorum sp. HK-1]|nr:chemotaxis protein CheY [Candidatus Magnetomorum sp. HK-1]
MDYESDSKSIILVVDDEPLNLKILIEILKTNNHIVRTAVDGKRALKNIENSAPDLILLDIEMPDMSGYEVCEALKKNENTKKIPVIFISSLNELIDKVKAFNVGAIDYITKPFEAEEVLARVTTHLNLKRINEELKRKNLILQKEITEHKKTQKKLVDTNEELKDVLSQLAFRKRELEQEQEFAKNIFNNIINPSFIDFSNIKYLISPMSIFNGDLLLVTKNLAGGQYIILGDFTGHGLKAAVGAIPVSDLIYAMSAKGFPIEKILLEINNKLHKILPTDVFFCCCFIEIDSKRNKLNIWNGGMPDVFIYNHQNKKIRTIKSNHLPLGIIKKDKYDWSIETLDICQDDQIVLYSDGVLEYTNSKNEMFGYDNLDKCFANNKDPFKLFDEIQERLKNFCLDNPQKDDITLVEISFLEPLKQITPQKTHPPEPSKSLMQWKLVMEFNSVVLRIADPIPMLMQLVLEKPEFEKYKGDIYTILTELLTNSLDHGILGLDSKLKQSPDGFALYFNNRLQALSSLDKGWLKIDMEHIPMDVGGKFIFKIEDSGPGFDYNEVLSRSTEIDPLLFSGRGIILLRSLCHKLSYKGKGNTVEAVYVWGLADHQE